MPLVLDTYDLVASSWDDAEKGVDAHVYEGVWGVIVLTWPFDDEDEVPDPWSDEYRAKVRAIVDGSQFYSSFREAAADIRENGTPATTRLLPALDRFTERPPNRHSQPL